MTWMRYEDRPPLDAIGWCHSCERVQYGREAVWVELTWASWSWACCECQYEPWDLGVWVCSCAECVDYDDEGRPLWGSPTPPGDDCWKVALRDCADAGCITYLFDCEHFT